VAQPSSAASFFMTLLFFLLAVGAFFIGLSIRYSKETGRSSLVNDIRNGVPPAEAPAEPEAATPEDPPED
jgi:hypothetical protein